MKQQRTVTIKEFIDSMKDFFDVMNDYPFGGPIVIKKSFSYQYKYTKEKDKYKAEVVIPGWKKDQVSIEIKGKSIFVKGTKEKETREFISLEVQDDQDLDNITSRLEDGILYIEIPIKEQTVRKVEIK